VIIIVDEMYR